MAMCMDITQKFLECVEQVGKTKKIVIRKPKQLYSNNSNQVATDFKSASVKLLESIFSLRQMLETIHEEYISLVPKNESDIANKCYQMELNAENMMSLCQECLTSIRSSKFIHKEIVSDIKLHREAVGEMLHIYLKGCQDLQDEIQSMKKRVLGRHKLTVQHSSVLDEENSQKDDIVGGDENGGDGELRFRTNALMIAEPATAFTQEDMMKERDQLYKQLTELGRMNEQLAEHVVDQHSSIERIDNNAQISGENIIYGNREMQGAMRNQSSVRFWLLFVLMVLSLSLILMDYLYGAT